MWNSQVWVGVLTSTQPLFRLDPLKSNGTDCSLQQVLLAVIYAMVMCKKMNINRSRLLDTIIVGLIAGVIGARLYYVIFYPGDKFIKDPISIFYIHEGGLGIYGGIIGALLVGGLFCQIPKTKCACGTGNRCARLFDWTSNRTLGKFCQPRSIWWTDLFALGNGE